MTDDIEITPEMIEAGAKVLWSSTECGSEPLDSDRLVVRDIFLAMEAAKRPTSVNPMIERENNRLMRLRLDAMQSADTVHGERGCPEPTT